MERRGIYFLKGRFVEVKISFSFFGIFLSFLAEQEKE